MAFNESNKAATAAHIAVDILRFDLPRGAAKGGKAKGAPMEKRLSKEGKFCESRCRFKSVNCLNIEPMAMTMSHEKGGFSSSSVPRHCATAAWPM